MTVTLLLPWNAKPVPAVQEASELLARIVNGEAENACDPTKAVAGAKQLTEAREVLYRNASFPMLVTELGMVTVVSALLPNASFPMLVTELGMVTDVS